MKRLTRRSVLATAGAMTIAVPAAAQRRGPVRVAGGSPPSAGGGAYITGVSSLGTPRTDSFQVGYAFTVGATSLTLTQVGRYANGVTGHTHTVTVYDRATQIAVPGATAVIDTTGATPGTFVYAGVSGTPVLWAGQQYFIGDDEGTGDTWYNDDTLVATTTDATLTSSMFYNVSASQWQAGVAGPNHPYVPVNFKYTVGAPGGITLTGSPFTIPPGDSVFIPLNGVSPLFSGASVSLFGSWVHGPVPDVGENITFQWMRSDVGTSSVVAISPVITSNNQALPYTWDSTSVPDGTYVIYPRILDDDLHPCFFRNSQPKAVIVHNSGFNNGSQTIPIAATTQNRAVSPRPDFIAYTSGSPMPARTAHPMSYTFIAGSSSSALRTDVTAYYGESQVGPRNAEYHTSPELVTTPSGGVYAAFSDPLHGNTTFNSYDGVVFENNFDGARMNARVSPFTNYVEDPAGGGKWWGAEINGRIFNITNAGITTTVVGFVRDRTQLTYDPTFPGITEADFDSGGSPKRVSLGTFPVGTGFGGANDLCFDPTDSNILYVAAQIDNWIGRVNLTTLVVTVYAGTPNASDGYTGDGGPAASCTFAQPSSIIMDGSRNMYVCDSNNQAIRKIAPPTGTVAGNITTLCGGTVGPTPPLIGQMTGGSVYNVSTLSWNNSTNRGTVVMTGASPNIMLGGTLDLAGGTATGGRNPNSIGVGNIPRYVVDTFTDNQHFTIRFEGPGNGGGAYPTGPFSGSMTLTTHNVDNYSSPSLVTFAAGTVPFPNCIRFTSNGDIIVSDVVANAARRIYLSGGNTGKIGRVGLFDDYLGDAATGGSEQWIWHAVDTAGMIGPVDDIALFKVQDAIGGAHLTWRLSLDGTFTGAFLSDGFALPTYGPIGDQLAMISVHYPWAIAISTHEGRFIMTGLAEFHPIMGRLKQVGDPAVDQNTKTNFNSTLTDNASNILYMGTVTGFPRETRPALWSMFGDSGGGWATNITGANTFEDLNATYASDGALGAYLQAGMGGAVARPEIVANNLRDLIYGIRRSTYAGGLPTPVQPGADDTNTTTPIILTCSAVRNTSTQITVSWTTDVATLGMVAAWGPGQFAIGLGGGALPTLFSALESSFGTSHSMACQVLSGVTPVHYMVICESIHGVFAHTTDQTVT